MSRELKRKLFGGMTQKEALAKGQQALREAVSRNGDSRKVEFRKGPMWEGGLTPFQRRFVAEYTRSYNAAKAVELAGGSSKSAMSTGYALLKKKHIQEAIRGELEKLSEPARLTAERVLHELIRISFYDPKDMYEDNGNLKNVPDMDEDVRRVIASVEVDELFEGRGKNRTQVGFTKKVKMQNKIDALSILAKHLKLLPSYHEHSVQGTVLHGHVVKTTELLENLPVDVLEKLNEAMKGKNRKALPPPAANEESVCA